LKEVMTMVKPGLSAKEALRLDDNFLEQGLRRKNYLKTLETKRKKDYELVEKITSQFKL
jgi:hypothetical protein